jgi:hypothetical protein
VPLVDRLAAAERAKAARDAMTLDFVNPGERQSEVEHDFRGEATDSGLPSAAVGRNQRKQAWRRRLKWW